MPPRPTQARQQNFYPRPPRGGRLFAVVALPWLALFLPTPSARRATCTSRRFTATCRRFLPTPSARRATCENPRKCCIFDSQFLPTPSARRATSAAGTSAWAARDFYPRPPRGGRPGRRAAAGLPKLISTHALREEGDLFRQFFCASFNISTHALREEGDRCLLPLPPCR